MPAYTVLPSDSISQAPRHRHHHHHHRSSRGSTGRNTDSPLLTEANLREHTSQALAAKQRDAELRERSSREVEEIIVDDDDDERQDVDVEERDDEVRTLRQSSTTHHSSASAARSSAAPPSKVSSSHRSGTVARSVVRDVTAPSGVGGRSPPDDKPQKWVIVEVDEYDDKIVEREYTIERVKRYHYNS